MVRWIGDMEDVDYEKLGPADHMQGTGYDFYAVPIGQKLVECDGEAHSSPHVDNCGRCLTGTWGWKLVTA